MAEGLRSGERGIQLRQKAIFPAQIQDCTGAGRWLRANIKKYNFDPITSA
jgi:acetyl esterase/lipase